MCLVKLIYAKITFYWWICCLSRSACLNKVNQIWFQFISHNYSLGNDNVDTMIQFDRNWLKPISTNWIFCSKAMSHHRMSKFLRSQGLQLQMAILKCNFQATFNLRKFVRMSKFLRSRSRKSRRGSDDNQLAAEEGGSPAKDRSSKKLNVIRFWK